MIREIKRLEEANFLLQEENVGLVDTNTGLRETNQGLHEINEGADKILEVLSSNGHTEEITKMLRNGESYQSIAAWLGSEPPIAGNVNMTEVTQRNLVGVVKRVEKYYRGNERMRRKPSPEEHDFQWTRVTSDEKLIKHLFTLYFTWVHPVYMLFSEMDFLESFENRKRTYSSSVLVNAICAMGCHLLDIHGEYAAGKDFDVGTLREGFMNEARSLTPLEDCAKMTAIQAFAVMFLVDLSSGNALRATGYLRLAADGLRSVSESEHSAEAVELSLWGIHTLNTSVTVLISWTEQEANEYRAWAALSYHKPFSPESPRSHVFKNVQMDRDDAVWRYYRQPGDKQHVPRRPSYAIVTAFEQAKLFRIVHETINVFCGARGKATSRAVLECYKRYLTWKDELPAGLERVDTGAQPLPHVLFLHIQFHTALVLLFLPFLHVDGFSGATRDSIKHILISHARSGLEVLEHSRRLYSCRFQLPFMAFCALHLGDVLIRYSPSEPYAPEVVLFCLEVLQENRPGFAICGPLQELLRRTAVECRIQLPENLRELMKPSQHYGIDDILDACTRISYMQPTEQIVRYLDPSIAENWGDDWQEIIGPLQSTTPRHFGSDSGRVMHINSLLNN
ncbi:MAG: hypothetical protein M1830_008121 [Pleopsidium flavum]|nr:MAG: hypothetical protein M1830_008121 [Pleopsidium flavum]